MGRRARTSPQKYAYNTKNDADASHHGDDSGDPLDEISQYSMESKGPPKPQEDSLRVEGVGDIVARVEPICHKKKFKLYWIFKPNYWKDWKAW